MTSPAPREPEAARTTVARRGLTGAAVGALSDIVRTLPIEALTPVKQLLKRFFSDQSWSVADDDALAAIVGTGSGAHELVLDDTLTMAWGWEHDRFFLRVADSGVPSVDDEIATHAPRTESDLGLTFESDVRPEVTPSPRTIRFTTPPLHSGPSLVYNSLEDAAGDERARRIFDGFDAVTNVLVGPDFVAVTIAHADLWDALLAPILRAVNDSFLGAGAADARPMPVRDSGADDGSKPSDVRTPNRLERAWADLGALRADRPADLDRVLAASHDAEPERRQVAAALLSDAPPEIADEAWGQLFGDESRRVRRSVVDAAVDANREPLRPLFERALGDPDAWIRWKAVHGLATLGVAPSRAAVQGCAADPDFRVRLEAQRALA